MPRRALDNPLVLAVLGLLLENPSHPDQMLADLRDRGENRATTINRGTLYDIVEALVAADWVAPRGKQRTGNRPERTVYALTEAGREELVHRLDSRIRNPRREFTQFVGAVAYLGALGPTGAADAGGTRARSTTDR